MRVSSVLIYVVDDDPAMGLVLKEVLELEGYRVEAFTSASDVLVRMQKVKPHILLTDYKMRDIDGLMLLKKVKTDSPSVLTIMMTAFGSIETAIEAMKQGAYHYLLKPFKNDELLLLIRRAVEKVKLTTDNQILRKEVQKNYQLQSLVGKSQAMAALFELVRLVSPSTAHVLISGESGAGKELVARAIHFGGPRKGRPFVPINCAAMPENLLESELFGHVKGAFTGAIQDKVGLFEEAHTGTLFLDEIGDLSPSLQAKLLRVLQDKQIRPIGSTEFRTIDVRVIAATHRDLHEMVAAGKFREDLFYRLNVIPVRVPSLRERKEDIPLLVDHFMAKFAAQNNCESKKLSPEAMNLLMNHDWPGNVRELENVIERSMVLTVGPVIDHFGLASGARSRAQNEVEALHVDKPSLEQLEERYIKKILREVNYNKDEAARLLGVSRRTLYRKEKAYGGLEPNPITKQSEESSCAATTWA